MEIDTKEITRINGAYKVLLESITNEYYNISKSIVELQDGWQGEKAKEYVAAIEGEYLKELKSAIDLLDNYYKYLSKVPSAYDKLDESYKNKKIEIK